MGTPILRVKEPDTGWLGVPLDPAYAERYGTERCEVRRVGPLVELVLSVELSADWTSGALIATLPSEIPLPRVQYRPPVVYGPVQVPAVVGRQVRLYSPAVAKGIYRLSDLWTV